MISTSWIWNEPLTWLLIWGASMATVILIAHQRRRRLVTRSAELEKRLAARAAELRAANDTLMNEAAERRRTEQNLLEIAAELERSNLELERSNQDLNDFAYIASHDLKEPLRGIENYAKFLLEDYEDALDEAGQNKLRTLGTLSQRLEGLINCLLHYSRVGRLEMTIEEVDLHEVLTRVIASLDFQIKSGSVDVRIPKRLPTLSCDRVRATEVFTNLISNSIKYNDKPERWIEIGWLDTSPVTFQVRDNGIGIRERHLDQIFTIFRRLHAKDRYGGGAGAGLTIAKKIAERHGGHLRVESEHREGSTFSFTLAPAGVSAAPHEPGRAPRVGETTEAAGTGFDTEDGGSASERRSDEAA